MEQTAAIKTEHQIGNGMSRKEAQKIREQSMSKEELAYLRRKRLAEKVWPFLRFLILFGLCFVILYPLIFMISSAFRDPADMSDPTVMWIPRHLSLQPIKDVLKVMNFGSTLLNTLLLNIGCSLVQVVTCSLTGYGFARFKFKGKNLLFGIVIMMILVPSQIILIPQYMQFRYFDIFGLIKLITGDTLTLTDTPWTMYLPALPGSAQGAGGCGISGRLRHSPNLCPDHGAQRPFLLPDRVPVLRGMVLERLLCEQFFLYQQRDHCHDGQESEHPVESVPVQ